MDPLLIAARTVHFAAAISLVGVFAFRRLIAGPLFAAAGEGIGPVWRLDRDLVRLAWCSLALAAVSGAVWLLAVAADISGQPLAAVLARGTWTIVLTRTRFGADWLARLGLAGLVGACLLLPGRRRGASSGALEWAALAGAAALLASLAWAGHGAATAGAAGDLHLAADILHLLGAGFWLGPLLPFALLLAVLRRDSGAGSNPLPAMVRRLSTLAAVSVAVLLAGGIANTWFLAGTLPALVGTLYGRLLLGKIALFLGTLIVASFNLLRLGPRVAGAAGGAAGQWLRRNALVEASLGLAVLAIVGVIGTLPPGLHSEPGWPFPFRLDIAALGLAAKTLLACLGTLACLAGVGAVASAAAGDYRRSATFGGGIILCLAVGWLPLRSAVEPAYPTSFYAPAEAYAAPSVARGAEIYAANCASCHGAEGRGDGPAAAGLPVRPANLTEAHLFAHTPGDLFWWVSHGRANGAMPGFAAVLTPAQRWDVVNFVRARAAGVLARRIGPQLAAEALSIVPDFAFERSGGAAVQSTLRRLLARGPVLLVLFAPPPPAARLAALAAAQPRPGEAGLRAIAVAIASPGDGTGASRAPALPLTVEVAPAVRATLALFRGPDDGFETELLLDRNGAVRARWTAAGEAKLPDIATLAADARRAAATAAAPPSHAGHTE